MPKKISGARKKSAGLKSSASMAERIAKAFAVLASGLPNPWDESTDFFRPFSAPFAAGSPINEATLKAALKIGARYKLDISDVGVLGEGYGEPEESSFRVLQSVMNAALTETKLVFARGKGVVRVRTWILGRTPAGDLAGLRTETTET